MREAVLQTQESTDCVLYIYQVDGQPDFWVFDGVQYCRFALAGARFHLVRTQSYLPPRAIGFSALLTGGERRALMAAAALGHVGLMFFGSVAACEREARVDRHPEFIFDRATPAGALTVQGIEFLRGTRKED